MIRLQWTRPLPKRRQTSLHEALFVLEKNATNLGTSNKSHNGLLEHKEALEFLSHLSLSTSEKLKKQLESTTLVESLVKILNPSETSALGSLNENEKKEVWSKALIILDNLASGKRKRGEKRTVGENVCEKLVSFDVFTALGSLIEAVTDVTVVSHCFPPVQFFYFSCFSLTVVKTSS